MKKKNAGFYLKIYGKILAQDLKSKMSYRADFIISTIGMIFTNISGFISFWILFKNFPSIAGWSYHEMLFLYGFSLVALTPVQCLFDNNWNLRGYVYSGDFIKYCFRPINIFFYYMSEVFDIKGLGQLAFGLGTIIYSWNRMGLDVSVLIILKMILFLITASLFMIALMNLAASTCFWMINTGYVMVIAFKFKDYSRYPGTIFNPVFRFIFTFIIPITFIAYYPSLVILRPDAVPALSWLSPVIGCLFFYLSYKVWMKGATGYNGTGS
ncbi:MAG: ABC-2 family transporter protein [Oscillospiraceae bacterium]|nr:ABC-2 family transporter protein [Oscillospiraceae bacterium]